MTENVKQIVNVLKNNKCFFDIDGTLCVCRFIKDEKEYCSIINKDFDFLGACILGEPYKDAKPTTIMQEVIEELDPDNIYTLGRSNGTPENVHKIEFLHKFYPKIKDENMIFVNSAEAKCLYLTHLKTKLKTDNLILIEDDYNTILMAENTYDLKCYHISSFLS